MYAPEKLNEYCIQTQRQLCSVEKIWPGGDGLVNTTTYMQLFLLACPEKSVKLGERYGRLFIATSPPLSNSWNADSQSNTFYKAT